MPHHAFSDYASLLNTSTALGFSYQTLAVEYHMETYIYDIGSFLSSAGGNLGLLLGFSFFTMLLGLINLIKRALIKKYDVARKG